MIIGNKSNESMTKNPERNYIINHSVISKIKLKIQNYEFKDLLYKLSKWTLSAFFLFILLTTIIQTNWVNINQIEAPILIWIISQPYVGVFFVPFMILVIYICWFIVTVAKPVTIKRVQSDTRCLLESNDIVKSEYETIHGELNAAQKRADVISYKTTQSIFEQIQNVEKNSEKELS